MALSGQVSASAQVTQTSQGAQDLAASSVPLNYGSTWTITSGVGANQADLSYSAQRTIPGGGNEDLDLATGTLATLGITLVFVKIKAIIIEALASNVSPITVGGAPTNTFIGPFGAATHTVVLAPGAVFTARNPGAGWTVTPTTADLLRLAGANQAYRIVLIGTSA
jgi:hypothetical protein